MLGWPQPPTPNTLGDEPIRGLGRPTRAGRAELSDDSVAIRDEDGLPACGELDVLAELVLQAFDAHGTHDPVASSRMGHAIIVATGSHIAEA